MITRLAVLLLILSCGGCVVGSQKEGRVISVDDVAKVKVGTTTRQQILDLFGPPTSFSRGLLAELRALGVRPTGPGGAMPSTQDVYTYEYREENETFFSVILLYTNFQRVRLADTLMVVFDPEKDIVKYLAFSKQTDAVPEPKEKKE